MKKTVLTLAVVLTMSLGASAQTRFFANDDANLDYEDRDSQEQEWGGSLPGFDETGDQRGPIGSGALLLVGFGAAYAAYKRRKEDK